MRIFFGRRKTLNFTLATIVLTLAFAGAALSQGALTITTNDFIPFAQEGFVPCANDGAGEIVLIQGVLHVQQHITLNNNRANLKVHFQPQGADGVGQTTGDKYNAVGVTEEQDSIPLTNGATETSIINNFRLIGPGRDNNLQVHQNLHITINANGVVTTVIDNTNVDCN